jgi:hypothetical protein
MVVKNPADRPPDRVPRSSGTAAVAEAGKPEATTSLQETVE